MDKVTSCILTKMHNFEPDETALNLAKIGISDFLAVTIAVIDEFALDEGWYALKSLMKHKTPQEMALLLGYAGHALDFDDYHPNMRGHPSTVILPALLAACSDSERIDDNRFLSAYCFGIEIAGLMGLAVMPWQYETGFHATSTLGVIAASAAICFLHHTEAQITAKAIGIAATQASGLRAQFGSAVKPLHAGLAAKNAVFAFELACSGVFGYADTILPAFIQATTGKRGDFSVFESSSSTRLQIIEPGLEFKPYPTCAGTHSAALCAKWLRLDLIARYGQIQTAIHSIKEITVSFPKGADIAASITAPRNAMEARFSLEYVIAAMLLKNELVLSDFCGPLNPIITKLASQVTRAVDLTVPLDMDNPQKRFHHIKITFTDSDSLEKRCDRQTVVQLSSSPQDKWHTCLAAEAITATQWFTLCQFQDSKTIHTIVSKLNAKLMPI